MLSALTLNVLFLILWFKSSFLIEYVKLLRLGFIFKLKDFENNPIIISGNVPIKKTYLDFLNEKYSKYFLIRLVTCPICLGFWSSLLISAIRDNLIEFPIICVASYFLYYIFVILLQFSKYNNK